MLRKLLFLTKIVLVIALAAAAPAFAAEGGEGTEGECHDCHEIVQTHWSQGAHANAVSSPGFQDAWIAAGRPDACFACHTTGYDAATGDYKIDSVSCTTCHYPEPANHPDQIMPTDVSSRLCGDCHIDTYSDWTRSVHAQEDLACVRCHSPHTNEIRADDAQELCSACHSDEVHFYSYTVHYEEGLLCVDCHVRVLDQPAGEGHARREHTFAVDMETCSGCHSEEMHFPGSGSAGGGGGAIDANLQAFDGGIQTAPKPVSPLGFALLAVLIGAALGMILSPWSERWFRRADI